MRRCLLDARDGCCAICGTVEERNDQPLVFVLDGFDRRLITKVDRAQRGT